MAAGVAPGAGCVRETMSDRSYSGDRIFVHALTTECIIGFLEWERRVKQTVVVDLELATDCRRTAETDAVADTLDYRKVVKRVRTFIETSEFHLIETLAERLACVVLEEFGIEWVRITLSKPGAFRHAREVGVTVERSRG
jgi:7,8-dihydroneopterin aldolase/epimerase/oxygenase